MNRAEYFNSIQDESVTAGLQENFITLKQVKRIERELDKRETELHARRLLRDRRVVAIAILELMNDGILLRPVEDTRASYGLRNRFRQCCNRELDFRLDK